MIVAMMIGAPSVVEFVSVAEAGATTYKPTVFGTSLVAYDHQDVPAEAVGTTTLTLTNVVAGSRYRIERQGDGSLATPEAAAVGLAPPAVAFDDATVLFDGTQPGETAVASYDGRYVLSVGLNYYQSGSDLNNLEVKVRKATAAPNYRPWSTRLLASSADVSTYVDQQPDD